MNLCWLVCNATQRKLESSEKREPLLRKCLYKIELHTNLKGIFLITDRSEKVTDGMNKKGVNRYLHNISSKGIVSKIDHILRKKEA